MPTPQQLEQSEDIRTLFHSKEWKSIAVLIENLSDKWKSNLTQFNIGDDSVEKLAMERIKWTAMIEGLQMFLINVNRVIEELNKQEKDRKDAHGNREEQRTG